MLTVFYPQSLLLGNKNIFEIVTLFLLVFFLTVMANALLMVRNYKVLIYRRNLLDKCKEYDNKHLTKKNIMQKNSSAFTWCLQKMPNYFKMLFSLKPLNDHYWLPEKIKTRLINN